MPQQQGVEPPKQRLSTPQTLHLMRLEVERAVQHGYPISCMMYGLDGYLEPDLFLHRKLAMPLVFSELKAVTFARELRGLGIWTEAFQLAVFPHVTPEAIHEMAEELLERARAIRHDDLPEGAPISLSIGISHNLHPSGVSFESLVEEAESGMGMAQASGGDQLSAFTAVETELDRLKIELEEQLEEIQKVTENVFSDSVADEELWGKKLVDSVLQVFQSEPDQNEAVLRLEKSVVELLGRELTEFKRTSSASQLIEAQSQIERLERRISKLTGSLGRTEEELKRIAALKDVDLGVASIYRTVQGLSVEDGDFQAKQEMLKNIFEANCALRAEMAKKS